MNKIEINIACEFLKSYLMWYSMLLYLYILIPIATMKKTIGWNSFKKLYINQDLKKYPNHPQEKKSNRETRNRGEKTVNKY